MSTIFSKTSLASEDEGLGFARSNTSSVHAADTSAWQSVSFTILRACDSGGNYLERCDATCEAGADLRMHAVLIRKRGKKEEEDLGAAVHPPSSVCPVHPPPSRVLVFLLVLLLLILRVLRLHAED
eukprot:9223589-Pyramimonas_sp.AAC.1